MKIYPIRYSSEAVNDLDIVWDDVYEASKNYDIADKYVDDLMDQIQEKEIFPQSGIPLLYGNLFTGFYSVNFKKYKAFYRIKDGYIEVARIIMNKRDYMKIIFDDDSSLDEEMN